MTFLNRYSTSTKWLTLGFSSIIILFIALYVSALFWISTDHGQTTIKAKITESLKDSGITLEATDIRWSFPVNLSIASLAVNDAQGTWLKANQLRIAISPSLNITENLTLNKIDAKTLTFLRTPEIQSSPSSQTDDTALSLNLKSVHIEKLAISPELTGLPETLILKLLAKAALNADAQNVTFQSTSKLLSGLPEQVLGTLAAKGSYKLDAELLDITSATLQNKALAITADAKLNVAAGTLSSNSTVILSDLAKWHKDAKGSVTLNNTVSGPLDALALNTKGKVFELQYNDMILPKTAITLTAQQQADAWQGSLSARSDDQEITYSSQYHFQGETLALTQIMSSFFGNTAKGNVSVNTSTTLANGTLNLAMPDLNKLSDIANIKVKGSIFANVKLNEENAKQALTFTANAQNITLKEQNLSMVKATITGTIPDLNTPMPQQLNAKIQRLSYDALLVSTLTSDITHDDQTWHVNLDANIKAPNNIQFTSTADIKNPETTSWDIVVSGIKGTWEKVPFKSLTPIKFLSSKENIKLSESKLQIGNAPVSLHYAQSQGAVNAHLDVSALKPYPLYRGQPYAFKHAKADIKAKLSGTPQNPVLTNKIYLSNIKPADAMGMMSLDIDTITTQNKTTLSLSTSGIKTFESHVNATLPTHFSMAPTSFALDSKAPISGDLQLASNLSLLVSLASTPEHEASGPIKGNMTLAGTLESPKINGTITVSDGQYKYLPLGTHLQNIETNISANGNTIRIESFRAEDNKKNPIQADGFVKLENKNSTKYAFELTAKEAHLLEHPNIQGLVSLDIKASGDNKSGAINGSITTQNVDIFLPSQFASNVKKLNVVRTIPSSSKPNTPAQEDYPLLLDVKVVVDQGVYVRGQGLNTELNGTLAITGDASNPEINGSLSTKRGRYEQFGKLFNLKKASLIFKGEIPPSPYLDVTASNKSSGVEVMPVITGPVLKPTIKITSSPSMPEEEALSVLLFGKDSKNISPIQAAQLASAIAKLSGHSTSDDFNPLGTARDLLGVDDLNVNGNGTAADTTVGVGKYLADDVYLQLERGAQNSSGKASIEVNVLPNISVQSSTGATGDNSVGVNWKYDY